MSIDELFVIYKLENEQGHDDEYYRAIGRRNHISRELAAHFDCLIYEKDLLLIEGHCHETRDYVIGGTWVERLRYCAMNPGNIPRGLGEVPCGDEKRILISKRVANHLADRYLHDIWDDVGIRRCPIPLSELIAHDELHGDDQNRFEYWPKNDS